MNTIEMSRFDARITAEQKKLFEKAAAFGGFRNTTEFVISNAEQKAKEIIAQRDMIIASERDAKIFFEAVFNPAKPNQALKEAVKNHSSFKLY